MTSSSTTNDELQSAVERLRDRVIAPVHTPEEGYKEAVAIVPQKDLLAVLDAFDHPAPPLAPPQASVEAISSLAPTHEVLRCPSCTALHIDGGEWATRPHHRHQCQQCKNEWDVGHLSYGIAPDSMAILEQASTPWTGPSMVEAIKDVLEKHQRLEGWPGIKPIDRYVSPSCACGWQAEGNESWNSQFRAHVAAEIASQLED